MSARNYMICGPAEDRDRANQAARAWDPEGGQETFDAPFLHVSGTDPTIATHTACCGPIAVEHAPAIQAAIAAGFPGWQMFESDDAQAGFALAGLAMVAHAPSSR